MTTTTEHEAITEHSRLETDIDTIEQECTAYIRDVVDALEPDSVYQLMLSAESTPVAHPSEGS